MILSETALRITAVQRDDKTGWISLTVLYRNDAASPFEQRAVRLAPEEFTLLLELCHDRVAERPT